MQEGCTQGGPWWCRTVVASCQQRTIEGRREGGCFPAHDPSSEGRAQAVGSTLAALPRRPSGGSRLLNRTDKEARSLLLPPELRGRDRELRGCGGGGGGPPGQTSGGSRPGACTGYRRTVSPVQQAAQGRWAGMDHV